MATAPLFGDPAAKARVWSKYAVLLGGLTADVPTGNAAFTLNDPAAGTPVTDQWDPVGALAEDSPFDDGNEQITATPHTAAGFGRYATTYSDQSETITFAAKETTLVTLGILYDVSDLSETTGNITGVLKQRDPTKKYLAAFHRENGTECERRITKNYATIDSISRSFGNQESLRTVTLLIVPTADSELYDYYLGAKA
jgi:hypothetical protein